MSNKIMTGKIIEVKGYPYPNSYIIEDGDEHTYLVHVGDIKENEQLLYNLYKEEKIATFKEGDSVQFESTSDHAIHVKKIN
jgi:hypothetical protein